MKVYIAGKIRRDKNYKAKFAEAEEYLKELGHSVMNPAVLPPSGFRHKEYMKICLAMLDVCDAVYMLPDWRKSKGARTEYKDALKKGKVIMFPEEKKYRPYTWEDMDKIFGRAFEHKRLKSKDAVKRVVYEYDTLYINGTPADSFLENYTWFDGSPCGVEITERE